MPKLTHHQYNELLKTPQIVLVASNREHVYANRGFVAYHSAFFACVISKANFEGTIELDRRTSVTAAKIFARWCYEGRLDPPNLEKANELQINDLKQDFLDLWIFSDVYQIPRLQNQSIYVLRQLFGQKPEILKKQDVDHVFSNTALATSPLRELVVIVLVARVDMGKAEIEDYEDIARAYPGFFAAFCKRQRVWFVSHGKSKQKAQKLMEDLDDDNIVKGLKVPVPAVPEWVLVLSGAKSKPQQQDSGEPIVLD